jgi:hypothetical protein
VLDEADVRRLAGSWADLLAAFASYDASGLTPSDVTLSVSQDELDELEAELGALE